MSRETLSRIITTLNQIEVKGKDNLDKLLGCIMVLERMLSESTEKEVNSDG